ncbi:MAG TPA: hypothetical protein VG890_01055 [Puia sp.]|nr:hypothetical protein [Puia sp.]
MKPINLLSAAGVFATGALLFTACSKTKSTAGEKIAPQEFISSTEIVVTPGHASGTGLNTTFTADGVAQYYYVDGATGQYFTITDGDTVKASTPTITFDASHQYRFQIQFRGEDGQPSNDEYTDLSDPEGGAYIHQFFFVPVATGTADTAGQVDDDGDALVGYVNLTGLTDHGGLDYQYVDSSADGSENLSIGLNGYFSVTSPGQSFDLVIDLRHGVKNKFAGTYFQSPLTYPWYDDAFSKATNDVNAPFGATDFATLVHIKTSN